LDDEIRHLEQVRDDEIRRNKKEILNKRISVIEEAISLMHSYISYHYGVATDMAMITNTDDAERKDIRVQDIYSDSKCCIDLISSAQLSNPWDTLSSIYWGVRENGMVDNEEMRLADSAYFEMNSIIDQLKAQR